MTRLLPLALLVAACAGPVSTPGGPGAKDAGASASDLRSGGRASEGRAVKSPASRGALVTVVSTAPEEVDACERLCGRVGDCLDESHRPDQAARLEFECLDACVHGSKQAPAHQEFLACETSRDCAALTGCAQQRWSALVAARHQPKGAPIATVAMPSCRDRCHLLFSCLSAGTPAHYAEYMDDLISECTSHCRSEPTYAAMLTKFQECAGANCGDPYRCLDESYK
jgi:hypothetical protein